MARTTYHVYVLSHSHKGGIDNYVFKCNVVGLTLEDTSTKNKLLRQLGIAFNSRKEQIELFPKDSVRIINFD